MGNILSTYFKLRESFNFDDHQQPVQSTNRSDYACQNDNDNDQRKMEIIKSIENQKVSQMLIKRMEDK